jgi:hypothetical protein
MSRNKWGTYFKDLNQNLIISIRVLVLRDVMVFFNFTNSCMIEYYIRIRVSND